MRARTQAVYRCRTRRQSAVGFYIRSLLRTVKYSVIGRANKNGDTFLLRVRVRSLCFLYSALSHHCQYYEDCDGWGSSFTTTSQSIRVLLVKYFLFSIFGGGARFAMTHRYSSLSQSVRSRSKTDDDLPVVQIRP
jgi:hypothetical protein